MRQYNLISGIVFVLSIIDFALAAPIPVQEKRQTSIDMVQIPRDVITVLEKRVGYEELEKVAEYFEKLGLDESHTSSSSTQPGPEHGSMNDVQVSGSASPESEHGSMNNEQLPAPNSVLSTANPNYPLVEELSPLSTPTSSVYDGSDTEFWGYWNNLEDLGYQEAIGPSQQVNGVAHNAQMDDVQQPLPPQENGVAHWHGTHMDNVQQAPPLEENGVPVAHGFMIDDVHQHPSSSSSTATSTEYEYGSDEDWSYEG